MEIVYVLGSTRSGTSALRNALCMTRFAGFGEGHLVGILQDVITSVLSRKAESLASTVPGNGMFMLKPNVLVRHFFHAYEQYLVEMIGSNSVVDKTPSVEQISSAPDLRKFHHDAKFIYVSRRHIDNIDSKMRKFPGAAFVDLCREWTACVEAWESVKSELGDSALAFDFYDLTQDRDAAVDRIAGFLALDGEDSEKFGAYLESKRPQADAGRDLGNFIKFSEVEWTKDQKAQFLAICFEAGEVDGYGLETYFA